MATLGSLNSARKACEVQQHPDNGPDYADGCQDFPAANRDKSMETMLDMILILGKENKSLKLEVSILQAELDDLKVEIKDTVTDRNAIYNLGGRKCKDKSENFAEADRNRLKCKHTSTQIKKEVKKCVDVVKDSTETGEVNGIVTPLQMNSFVLEDKNRDAVPCDFWKPCRYCGEIHQWGSQFCNAFGKICRSCGKENHLARVCRSKLKSSIRKESKKPCLTSEDIMVCGKLNLKSVLRNNTEKFRELKERVSKIEDDRKMEKDLNYRKLDILNQNMSEMNSRVCKLEGTRPLEKSEIAVMELQMSKIDFANAVLPNSTRQITDLKSGEVWLHLLNKIYDRNYTASRKHRRNYNKCLKILQAHDQSNCAEFILENMEELLAGNEEALRFVSSEMREILSESDKWELCEEIDNQVEEMSCNRWIKKNPVNEDMVVQGKCTYCMIQHEPGVEFCDAYGKMCTRCLKKNHFAEACKSKRRIYTKGAGDQ